MNGHLIFIYGSLRRGGANDIAQTFPAAEFVANATIKGTLYDLAELGYPGLILDNGNRKIVGEVYRISDRLLLEIDEFENADGYFRTAVDAVLENGETVRCCVYKSDKTEYLQSKIIASGDWIKHSRSA